MAARRPTLFALGMAVCMVLLTAGCGGTDGQTGDAAGDAAATQATSPNTRALTAIADTTGDSCHTPALAHAGQIRDAGFRLEGPNAVASAGDFMLSNSKAAFVISGDGPQKTYFHYHGILVDAVPLKDCVQASPDLFFELPLMVGRLDIARQPMSVFRTFKAETVEVINDGRDGKAAVVRATGSDDVYWLLELETIAMATQQGFNKPRSTPMDLDITVDYILEPGSPTLKIEYRLQNRLNAFNSVSLAFVLMSAGQGPLLHRFSSFDAHVQGQELRYGLPWVTGSTAHGSYLYSANSDVLTTLQISGVDALFDARQVGNTYFGTLLDVRGTPGDTLLKTFYVSVSDGDEADVVSAFVDSAPTSVNTIATDLAGQVVDAATGEPVADASVEFQTRKQILLKGWPWETFVTARTDDSGHFSHRIPLIDYLPGGQPWRVVVRKEGRADSTPTDITPGDTRRLTVAMPPEGRVTLQITDEQGVPSPAQVSFYRNGQRIKRVFTANGRDSVAMAPGVYDVVVSRGFEYAIVRQTLDVVAGNTALAATLRHVIPTDGYLSYDAHVHSSPSPDSDASPAQRIRTAAATGLDVVVSTDHEIITDLGPGVLEAGAEGHVATVIGQEVTAPIPNHTIAFPLKRNPSVNREFVPWHGKGIGEIFALEKEYGAQIRTIAHPRSSYMNLIRWDRIAGAPGLTDPTRIGLPAGTALWSWDFEAMELMNGTNPIFITGVFDDWMSMLNHGRRIAATGASDVHYSGQTPGMPRTYFRAEAASAAGFREQMLVDAIKRGQLIVSAGAFAEVQARHGANVASIGDTLVDTDGSVDLDIRVMALPEIDVDQVRIYANCDLVARLPADSPDALVKFERRLSLDITRDAHIVVMALGKNAMPAEFDNYHPAVVPRVVTNPVYADIDGNGRFDAPGGKTCQRSPD